MSENPEVDIQENNDPVGDNDNDVFERIADKLIRSGLHLTALELHAEMMERGRELSRLRDFFDNAKNFEKQPEVVTERQPQHYLQVTCPSEHTFDSCDFSHFSDEQPPMGGIDERVAVLEFELRKAQQTINSLRASLTESTTAVNNPDSSTIQNRALFMLPQYSSQTMLEETGDVKNAINHNPSSNLAESNKGPDSFSEFGRGSADGDSCPGDDQQMAPNSMQSVVNNDTAHSISSMSLSKSNTLPIKSHEKRVLNFLTNEFLMANNYKLTSITFADEVADQDLDRWEDVGLDLERPPDLLKLYRLNWQNSLQKSNS